MDKIKYPTKLMMIKFLEKKRTIKLQEIQKEFNKKKKEVQLKLIDRLPEELKNNIQMVDDYIHLINNLLEHKIVPKLVEIKDEEEYKLEKKNSYSNAFSVYTYTVTTGGSSDKKDLSEKIGITLSDKTLREDENKLIEEKNIADTKVKEEYRKLIINLDTFPRNKQRYEYLTALGFDLSDLVTSDKIEESIGLNKIDIKAIQ